MTRRSLLRFVVASLLAGRHTASATEPTPDIPDLPLTQAGLATPNASSNPVAPVPVLSPPQPDFPGGFQSQPLQVVLRSAIPGSRIFYTLDGSEPGPNRGLESTFPLDLAPSGGRGAVTLRAIALRDGWQPSEVTTHTYLFPDAILDQSAAPAGFPAAWVDSSGRNTITADYEMDPEVVENPTYTSLARAALTSLPTLSIVTDLAALFDRKTGIYANPEAYGEGWERPCSAEFIYPLEGRQIQVNAGIRLQGGTSRIPTKAHKHSLRLLFKGEHGARSLEERLFADSPVERFDTLVLDAGLNLVWIHPDEAQRTAAQYVRDQVVADWQNAMGHPAPHGRWFHLYLNGLYWGMFGVHERPDEHFAAAYLGGAEEDWDVVKNTTSFEIVSGNRAAWDVLLASVQKAGTQAEAFSELASMLDLTALADYLILNFYAGNTDWPHHNWYAARPRVPGGRWRFLSWDAEHVFKNIQDNRTTANEAATPGGIWNTLRSNPEFRLLFADRVHRHTTGTGVFAVDPASPAWDPSHPERNRPAAAYMRRIREIDPAIVLESARWGDDRREPPYTRNVEWQAELTRLLRDYFPRRTAVLLSQLRGAALLPSVSPPALGRPGGHVPAGSDVTLLASGAAEIWWTGDASDPREYGSGNPSPRAQRYDAPIPLAQSTRVRARARGSNGEWSALAEADFLVGGTVPVVSISEILYAPSGGDAFEFVELWNPGTVPVEVGGFSFDGIEGVLPAGWVLAPGERGIVASGQDPARFRERSPGLEVAAWFRGRLADSGERLALRDRQFRTVTSVRWRSDGDWPSTEGGFSIEFPNPSLDPGEPLHWTRSASVGGSPGHEAPGNNPTPTPVVRIHEIFPGGDGLASLDWVEFHNSTEDEIRLSGWRLSDRLQPPRGLAFDDSHRIPPGGMLTLPLDPAVLGLDRDGDRLVLLDPVGRRVDGIAFGPIPEGYSLGRTSDLGWMLNRPTPGTPNQPAQLGLPASLCINEVFPNPVPGADDWLELFNRDSERPVALEGLVLESVPDDATAVGNVSVLRIPGFIAPRGHVVWRADHESGIGHIDLTLPAAGGTLKLQVPPGQPIDTGHWPATPENASIGRNPDGDPIFAGLPAASPGASNLPVPRILSVRVPSPGRVEFQVEAALPGAESLVYVVEGSPDLIRWAEVHRAAATAIWTATLKTVSLGHSFYRVRLEAAEPN